MKYLITRIILFLVIAFTVLSCTKNDLPVIENPTITKDIQINSLFNIINLDDGFLVTGISNSKVTISKLDINFSTVWEKNNYEWGTTFSTGGWGGSFYAVDIIKIIVDKNGNYTCFCSITEGGDVIWSSALVVKLDRLGNEINKIELDNTALINVTETNDNGYMLFGNKLIKLNADLSQEWENNDQNYVFTGASIIPTNDNGLALTGTWNSDQVFLQKFDGKGVLQWTKRNYNQKPFNDLGYDLVQLANGGFLIIGRTRDLKQPWDMNCFIIRTDISGDTIWTKKFGEEYNEWLENFLYTSNNDFIIKETVGFPNDTIHKTILLRMSLDGQIIDSKETTSFEKMIYSNSGYFVRAEKTGDNTIRFSKVQINDLFSK
jgi:hypothetical protein